MKQGVEYFKATEFGGRFDAGDDVFALVHWSKARHHSPDPHQYVDCRATTMTSGKRPWHDDAR